MGDGSHIIYVNGEYRGDDPVGKLMHDFSCKESKDIEYEALRKGVQHFKEGGGREQVCKAVEEYGRERALETTIELVRNLMANMKITLDQAMQILGISSEQQAAIRPMFK
ncbi:MAG: hypothetical protein Q4E57_08155 [Eubacteriales bacterium]|nr:hypothetical protein [Eubacteriales bacterium]